jgi:phosphopantothenate synthetase
VVIFESAEPVAANVCVTANKPVIAVNAKICLLLKVFMVL